MWTKIKNYFFGEESGSLTKTFLKHVNSSIIAMFGVMASVMANNIIAGKFFGVEGLAVMSVVAPFYSLFATIGALTGVGGMAVTSRAIGRDDLKRANISFTLSIVLSVIIYFFVALICFLFLNKILYMLGSSEEVFEAAKNYSEVYIIGGFGITLMYLPYNFFKLQGKLKLLTNLYLLMAVLNIFLDIAFVKIFDFGVEGIALGTVLSTLGISLYGMKFLLSGEGAFKIIPIFNKKMIKDLLKFGMPSALNNLLTFARLILLNRIIVVAGGSGGLAAFSVFTSLEKLSLVVLSGLAQATVPFIGVFNKELDTISERRIEILAHAIGFLLVIPMMIFIMTFPTEIAEFFGIHQFYSITVAEHAIILFGFSLLPSVCCLLMFSYYQVSGFLKLANLLVFCRSFLFLIVPAYMLTPTYGLDATWFSLTIASLSPIIAMLIFIPYYSKKGYSGIFLQDLTAEKNGEYISFVLKSDPQIISESVEKISDFCKKNELTKKEIMLISLSMEEMMMSIREHCFDNKSDELIDVRILIVKKNDDVMIILRLRNNGKLFNPIEYYEQMSEKNLEDMDDAMGIAMIVNAADTIHYKTTFGINNLTIIIDRK